MGLALSLARIPPHLLCFRPLSQRLRRRLVRVASVGEAVVSRSGFSSKQRPCSFSARVRVGMRCRYPKGFGDHRCVLERIPFELAVNRQYLETNKRH